MDHQCVKFGKQIICFYYSFTSPNSLYLLFLCKTRRLSFAFNKAIVESAISLNLPSPEFRTFTRQTIDSSLPEDKLHFIVFLTELFLWSLRTYAPYYHISGLILFMSAIDWYRYIFQEGPSWVYLSVSSR